VGTRLSDLTLVHYSSEPLAFDSAREYKESGAYKPRGFWVSVLGERDWPAWCEAEGFQVKALRHGHQVTLRADARVLLLQTPHELDNFTARYGRAPDCYRGDTTKTTRRQYTEIDWGRVAEQHDGLVVAPYQWQSRHEHMWYYGWDCASGCIWNLGAVEKVWTLAEEKT
jgi:hypothetical protein